MSFEDTLDRHHNCQVVILPRYHKNKPYLIPGLYCQNHGKLIKWLSHESAEELKHLGVEELEPIKIDKLKAMQQQLKMGIR